MCFQNDEGPVKCTSSATSSPRLRPCAPYPFKTRFYFLHGHDCSFNRQQLLLHDLVVRCFHRAAYAYGYPYKFYIKNVYKGAQNAVRPSSLLSSGNSRSGTEQPSSTQYMHKAAELVLAAGSKIRAHIFASFYPWPRDIP